MAKDTKAMILETAAKCIARHGIEKSTTRKIAEMAGVSRGLVPYYIPKREDLLFQVIQHIFETVRAETKARNESLTGMEMLLSVLRTNFEEFLGRREYYACFLLSYYYCNFNKKFLKLHTEQYEHNRTGTIKYLEEEMKARKVKRTREAVERKAEEVLDLLDGGLLFFSAVEQKRTLTEYTDRRIFILRENLNKFLE
jgi:AcrR family transcriptional regulator